jgi:hypothetical protein
MQERSRAIVSFFLLGVLAIRAMFHYNETLGSAEVIFDIIEQFSGPCAP